MNEELEKLVKERDDLNIKIKQFDDGFFYKMTVMSYRVELKFEFKNLHEFLEEFYYYESGDNGIIKSIESDNPETFEQKYVSHYKK